MSASEYVVRFEHLRMADVPRVGGKNASLGEMIGELGTRGIRVPGGFATTASAYREFLATAGLARRIEERLQNARSRRRRGARALRARDPRAGSWRRLCRPRLKRQSSRPTAS